MKITGLKWDHLLKTGQNAFLSKFVGTRGHDTQKKDNSVLNGMYGHPILIDTFKRSFLHFLNKFLSA